MYIDEEIILRDDLPEGLQKDFAELQELYDAGDWLYFDNLFEVVEATVKSYYIAGKISREDLNQIFHKYGLYCKCQYKNVVLISYKHVGKTTCLYDIFSYPLPYIASGLLIDMTAH